MKIRTLMAGAGLLGLASLPGLPISPISSVAADDARSIEPSSIVTAADFNTGGVKTVEAVRPMEGTVPMPPPTPPVSSHDTSPVPSAFEAPPLPPAPSPAYPAAPWSTSSPSGGAWEIDSGPALEPSKFDWSKFSLGGQYRILPNASNFGFHAPTIGDDQETSFVVLQRMRLWLTYQPTENTEGYIQMQVGQVPWGTGYDFNKSYTAGGTPVFGDHVGVQLRRSWLALKDEDLGVLRAGILDWHDSFDDTMASSDYDFNVSGVDWTVTLEDYNNLKAKSAVLMLNDQAFIGTNLHPGDHVAYLMAWDLDQPIGDDHSVGLSTYYIHDRGEYSYPTAVPYHSSWDVWVGLRGKLGLEYLPLNGFLLANTGKRDNFDAPNFTHTGWAAKLGYGPYEIGPGAVSVQGLYASGGKGQSTGHSNEFRTLAQSYRDNYGAQGYWSYLQLTSPSGPGDISDLGVGLQNRGFGLATAQVKYDMPLTPKLNSTSAVGWLRSATPNILNEATNIGTELLQQFAYDFGGGMKLETGAAALLTGDFYRDGPDGPDPDNLYELFTRFQLEF